ncbi:Crp/Fnr family transcriptional regulator [Micromonospora sp. NPDC048935]|uniref:Crp/Fnr family transcriptional regulator n=1 Tax=Micromonospora sp. NPDC048935 TaxID=3364262 RepID=UPI00371E4992
MGSTSYGLRRLTDRRPATGRVTDPRSADARPSLAPQTDRDRHPRVWQVLSAAGRRRPLTGGAMLPSPDRRTDAITLVLEGAVKEVGLAENGTTATLTVRPAGSIVSHFGDPAAVRRSVVAVLPSLLVTVSTPQVSAVVRDHAWLAAPLLDSIGCQTAEADDRLLDHLAYDAPERVRRSLLHLAHLFRGAPGATVVPLAQQDLADLAGVSREATARELRRLRESGAVRTGRSRIVVLRTDLIASEA